MENLLKREKGITLVALIITVILMLILAGIAISVLTDDGGLFGKTKNAANSYEKSTQDENATITNLINVIDRYLMNVPTGPSNVVDLSPIIEKYYTVGFRINVPEGIEGSKYVYYVGNKIYESEERTIDALDFEPQQECDIQIGVLDENGNVTELSNKIKGKTIPRKEIIL